MYDDAGILYKPSEIEYISKRYRVLYANRIDQIMHERTELKKLKSIQKGKIRNHSYRPDINDKSALIVSSMRETVQDQRAVEDRLISYKNLYLKQRTDKFLEKEEQDSRMLSFHPNLNNSNMTPRQMK